MAPTVQDDDVRKWVEAAETIRALVDKIILTPVEGMVEIDIQGDLN